jgi:outer membrane protein OmpA-like peptidoglycan-associated protein
MAESFSLDDRADAPAASAAAPASLFAVVKASIGSELPRHAARFLGEDATRVSSAMDLLITACLRRFARRIATNDGAARLFGDLANGHLDADLSVALDRLLVDPPAVRGPQQPGDGALARLTERHFGRSAGPVVRAAAAATGLGIEAVRWLLVITTSHVFAAFRDYMNTGNLDAHALRLRLAEEYPSALAERWHLLGRAAATKLHRHRRERTPGALAVALAPAVALAVALAAAVALAWRSTVAPKDTEGAGAPRQLSADGEGQLLAFGTEASALVEFLSNDTAVVEHVFVLDRVQFEPASAMLKSTSNAQLRELAAALAAFPGARITLEAHADRDTKEELALAEQRAVAIRAALAVFGIPLSRTNHAGVSDANGSGPLVQARVTKG